MYNITQFICTFGVHTQMKDYFHRREKQRNGEKENRQKNERQLTAIVYQ